MGKFQLPNGDHFLENDTKDGIIWLHTGAKNTLHLMEPLPGGASDNRDVVSDDSSKVVVSEVRKDRTKVIFTLTAKASGTVIVTGRNAAGGVAHRLVVVAGKFEKHKGMEHDLIADICRGSDPAKTLAVQRLLFSQSENVFDQLNAQNVKKFGKLGCGKVVNASGRDLFGAMSQIDYEHPYHEPLSTVKARTDVRYRSETITKLRTTIKGLLAKGTPVRVGVLDSPIGMFVKDRKLIAYYAGGHTTLIFACDASATRFLYIDTWPGGSRFKYEGGIQPLSDPCEYMGMYVAKFEKNRAVGKDKGSEPNLILQDSSAEGTFKAASGNFLEIVSGPKLPPR